MLQGYKDSCLRRRRQVLLKDYKRILNATAVVQAREDAALAQEWYKSPASQTACHLGADFHIAHACAFLRSGEAFMAVADHEDRDACQAAKVQLPFSFRFLQLLLTQCQNKR